MKRREFLTYSAAAASTLLLPSFSFADKKRMGLQLYSLRDVIMKDVAGTLKQVANFGYKELETYGYSDSKLFGMPVKEFTSLVHDLGMNISSGHYGTGQGNPSSKGSLVNDWERAVADAKQAGQVYMNIAYLQEAERKTLDDYKKVCGMINKAAEVCKKYGIRLGYHNHAFEFEKMEGQVPYDVMLGELDAKNVSMEMDLFWTVNAGQDPLHYFAKYPGRFEQWHVKDMDKTNVNQQVNVGTGRIDFKAIFAKASLSGLKQFYVEQEAYPIGPVESIKACADYVKTLI
jgi:sugar phosphate isomerase/epimerase